jgi:hypothetical protein
VKTRTTQEDRDELRKYFVDLIDADEARLPPRYAREKFMMQVLLDCQEAIDRVESIENRLINAYDSTNSAHQTISSLLTELRR